MGITTLEWLLVVAAVAGVAALAVVVVQNVVGDSAETVVSHSARQEAAELATMVLTERWQAQTPTSESYANQINRIYSGQCRRLGILYGDVDLIPDPALGRYERGGTGWGKWRDGRYESWRADKPSCDLAIPR
jgi:type II secretory pathway pseudopilin PulG